jgi:hypothetical protein
MLVEEEEPEQLFDGLFNILKVLQPSWAQLAWHDIETVSEKRNGLYDALCSHPRHKELEDKVLGAALVGVEA